ncbi:class I SAM-dependent methyltransferase [Emticicia sp. 21SJ11W-3]|uniref:class I SAM-dependent methyltransferase n=1 Tax=Emticicia sp. 21SJ11W-3 TaxID=2916755 RepID=UPI0020A12327|nr:class I SAM-dependent methyltransferase [Emticicia sp. 21SJ11W-3]UTA69843.1 class I SAM-dependent methyltransferase [Emticicia sp. 21SJ11W-3]
MNIETLRLARDKAWQLQITDIQAYVLKNPDKLKTDFLHLVADQWVARQKAKFKLPGWYANPDIIYPASLSVEQSSSEATAEYKARLFFNAGYPNLIDLTGGMGVDSAAFARSHQSVIYVERNKSLTEIAASNFKTLGLNNIQVVNADAVQFLSAANLAADTHFYIDPARRDASKNKVFKIEDCEPDILQIKHKLSSFLIKYSPMLDIKLAMSQLEAVAEVHIVAVDNEVKELLFLCHKSDGHAKITAANLINNHWQTFSFNYEAEQMAEVQFSLPLGYIYEPNAALLKAGAFKSIAQKYGLNKLSVNSHLYTTDKLIKDFPGRVFACQSVCRFDKSEVLAHLNNNQANVSTRNFPIKAEEVKKKLGLKDGGDTYLFATENFKHQKIILICQKPTEPWQT